ncbi:Uncharacterised protein [Campylobacter hyointestinalis subsp. hyointestinalis]|uniref:Uncharacterized protein n=1 Tax=Campylobacter hyointestinalis subsp. hyointestinalis TaxID=91352 RepID=A0A0S4SXG2_CAMHY|nr:hypothetical protein [Campylobacter hyointestinalis]CUU75234.1 Uncharacterised protein [Campylobacter hyointestinalis subsp. hyointestinalis]CUU90489.1 Uncharacterised protein [Campylobacter hyointestinalis subsp. hyointestinalis]
MLVKKRPVQRKLFFNRNNRIEPNKSILPTQSIKSKKIYNSSINEAKVTLEDINKDIANDL